MSMTATLEKNVLTIVIDANTKNPPASASGKTNVVASTHGNQATSVLVNGKPLVIGVNAYVRA